MTSLRRLMFSGRSAALKALMAAMVLSLPLSAGADLPPGGSFIDDDGNTHEGNIEAIAAEDITRGCNPPFNDRFCPDDPVTRGQMAAFIKRALQLPHTNTDHFTDDNGSTFEADINAIAEAGITRGCNPPDNDRYCPSDLVKRDQMASFLARAEGLSANVPPPRPELAWVPVVQGLEATVQALSPPGQNWLLIAEQSGVVRKFENGSLSNFLDIRDLVTFSGERGLLSIAVHPDFPADRRLFAWYYGTDDQTHLVEFDIASNLNFAFSPRAILSVPQPATNHNGGYLSFGSDGYLHLGLGDGGGSNDVFQNARDLNTLLGKLIRIDVDGAHPYEIPADNPYVGRPGRDEIWASGLRNPWRWSFDSGLVFIGDVGQATREEVNVVPVEPVGYDFGWSRFEGSVCNPNDHDPSCSQTGLTFPVAEYGRTDGRAVTGGIVYRGPIVRSLSQYYLYADVFSGLIRGFRVLDGSPVELVDLTDELGITGIVDFAEDGDGELLATSLFRGAVYRLTGG
ncbi:MAG TPA: PQQ-dependent sugar dehydrogenase [Acidimicrobiia bacterium]|nr:PQQ-dependent sugar dehydrogenase [Acidimicrobiia bacterium]